MRISIFICILTKRVLQLVFDARGEGEVVCSPPFYDARGGGEVVCSPPFHDENKGYSLRELSLSKEVQYVFILTNSNIINLSQATMRGVLR